MTVNEKSTTLLLADFFTFQTFTVLCYSDFVLHVSFDLAINLHGFNTFQTGKLELVCSRISLSQMHQGLQFSLVIS